MIAGTNDTGSTVVVTTGKQDAEKVRQQGNAER
jgi:hypothetical protein